MKKHIPNTLTMLNLASGFLAVLFLATGDVTTAVYLVLAAAFFDFADGFSARMLHAYSDLGKQLDSLADMVSFGVVPALILFHELLLATGKHFPAPFPGIVFQLSPLLLVLGAGLRLGRFNLDTGSPNSFTGLPTPAMALFMISLPLVRMTGYFGGIAAWLSHPSALAVISLVFGWLMVSRFPMFSLKMKTFGLSENLMVYIFLSVSLVLFIIFLLPSLFLIIILYIFMALGTEMITPRKAKSH